MNAQAIVFPEPKKIELRRVELPPLQDWDVVVELERSAISLGTERWALNGQRPDGDVTFPCIPGYLSVGKITAMGSAASERFSQGDRINFLAAVIPEGYGGNWMCGHLSPAVVNADPAKLGAFEGMPYVEKVPGGLSAEDASLAGLAAVACRGIDMADIKPEDRVVVMGQGIIGHSAAQICRLKGAKVLTVDTMPGRVELSRRFAADVALNGLEDDVAARIAEFTEDRGADALIDTTGSVNMIQKEIAYLKRFGTLVFQGWYPPPCTLVLHDLQLKFLRAMFPCGHSGAAVSRCMNWMKDGMLRLNPLITHRFTPDQAAGAYDLVLNRPEETMGIVFDWTGA